MQFSFFFSECPVLPPSPGHLCVAPAGVLDCHYSAAPQSWLNSDNCCCGQCMQDFTISCEDIDSTTGAGFWRSDFCPAEGCGSEGECWNSANLKCTMWCWLFGCLKRYGALFKHLIVTGILTSPNYPNIYPETLRLTEMIQVKQGLIIALEFTAFDVLYSSFDCSLDHLTILDGDGGFLLEKSCGTHNILTGGKPTGLSLPAPIVSRSNTVKFFFASSNHDTKTGWSVNWRAVSPGVCRYRHQIL